MPVGGLVAPPPGWSREAGRAAPLARPLCGVIVPALLVSEPGVCAGARRARGLSGDTARCGHLPALGAPSAPTATCSVPSGRSGSRRPIPSRDPHAPPPQPHPRPLLRRPPRRRDLTSNGVRLKRGGRCAAGRGLGDTKTEQARAFAAWHRYSATGSGCEKAGRRAKPAVWRECRSASWGAGPVGLSRTRWGVGEMRAPALSWRGRGLCSRVDMPHARTVARIGQGQAALKRIFQTPLTRRKWI